MDPAPASPNAAALQSEKLAAATEKIRQRAELSAKALGALGSTLLTAVGIAKFSDVYPLPDDAGVVPRVVIAGFGLMALAVLSIFVRLVNVNEPIIWRTDLSQVRGLKKKERAIAELELEDTATLADVESLRSYEARGHRLERVARRLPDEDLSAKVRVEADGIRAEAMATLHLANLQVVRYRSSQALKGAGAMVAYVLFILGLVLFAVGADYLQSERSDRIDIAKRCAEARAADAIEEELPPICGRP